MIERFCPGKVPALIAGDVAYLHELTGGGAHCDVACFAKLPLPWDVVLDGQDCPASLVRSVCAEVGIDPEATGWTQPYRQSSLATTGPAPALVHGVEVSSPALVATLRGLGLYSGQV